MTIGTGIAIFGIWMFTGMVHRSRRATGLAMLLSLAVAFVLTILMI